MNFLQNLIKYLFPDEIITHRICDLNHQLSKQNNNKNRICISIEKENKSRQFCVLTIEQLNTLYHHCPITQRTLYESIPPIASVKAYIDFEYFIDNNLDIQNHYIGPTCCLKILYNFLNFQNDHIHIIENSTENILKQFLVLQASTSEKISYHFIHANPSILFENILSLQVFMKIIVHHLLLSIVKHKCPVFDIPLPTKQSSISNLIQILAPYITILRKYCTCCQLPISNISISDATYILIQNKTNKWTLAIDMNVYSKNQQFRLFNSVKYGKNNPLIPSIAFPFDKQSEYSSSDLLQKSLITFNLDDHISKLSFNNNKFVLNSTTTSTSNSINTISQQFLNISLINEHLHNLPFNDICNNTNTTPNTSHLLHPHKINSIDLSDQNSEILTTFVESIIRSDSTHQGYIQSCVPGNYNKNILFYNIGGNYRYCPKKNAHHQHNSVAIMINSKNLTYTIRCKDPDCDNSTTVWKKIE